MHPFVKILTFILILLLMNFLSNQLLWLLCLLVCAFAARLQFKNFLRVVKRMRWLFISIFLIYAFGTPGEYIQQFPASFAPTFEGSILGFLQIAKLLIALAALSILFATSSKENLMVGLYMLLSPLKSLGFNVEQFAARLLLTLDYVEELASKDNYKLSFQQLADIHLAAENLQTEKVIVLQISPFNMLDKGIIVIFIISTLALIVFRLLS